MASLSPMLRRALGWGLGAAVGAASMRLLAVGAWSLAQPFSLPSDAPLPNAQLPAFTAAFVVFFAPILLGVAKAVAGHRLAIRPSRLVAAAGVTLLCAATLEIAVDSLFAAAMGNPVWRYSVGPVHHGYTSVVGVVMWPMYGAFVELIHEAIKSNPRLAGWNRPWARAALIAVEAMALEIAANLFSIVLFGRFFFYYFPGDLLHLTTFQIFVPYVVAGYLGVTVLDRVQAHPKHAYFGVVCWILGALGVGLLARG